MKILLPLIFLSGCGSFYANGTIGWGSNQKVNTSLKVSQEAEQSRFLDALFAAPKPTPTPTPSLGESIFND